MQKMRKMYRQFLKCLWYDYHTNIIVRLNYNFKLKLQIVKHNLYMSLILVRLLQTGFTLNFTSLN